MQSGQQPVPASLVAAVAALVATVTATATSAITLGLMVLVFMVFSLRARQDHSGDFATIRVAVGMKVKRPRLLDLQGDLKVLY